MPSRDHFRDKDDLNSCDLNIATSKAGMIRACVWFNNPPRRESAGHYVHVKRHHKISSLSPLAILEPPTRNKIRQVSLVGLSHLLDHGWTDTISFGRVNWVDIIRLNRFWARWLARCSNLAKVTSVVEVFSLTETKEWSQPPSWTHSILNLRSFSLPVFI